MTFYSLPEECISTILALTTPLDVCRCLLISSSVRSSADSNIAWEKFLPTDYQNIMLTSVPPIHDFSSKKELYFRLCDSILIDQGKKNFWLERSTGKKCYMLSARELYIPWGHDLMHWSWKSIPQSRFAEAVELRTISWLEIMGKINAGMLSSKTTYIAYLVFKIADRAYGLDSIPSETLVQVGNQAACAGTTYLGHQNSQKQKLEQLYFSNRMQVLKSRVKEGNAKVPKDRKDGWMEIELGEFFIDNGDEGEVKMSLMEIKGSHLKGGLIVEGIEVRPKTE
ncbi:F-box protein pp2-b15 [Thalictrum thalictroides]|uniref:F-box protein pp2-b15 n=1 Tax=Thalictrum thalictroides TaxID=46969 RepID=A0A7J6XB32_THATH|nr:F-box protein pp2-b15 [Thalictrum thalictroides]